jgi:hypothetical protein
MAGTWQAQFNPQPIRPFKMFRQPDDVSNSKGRIYWRKDAYDNEFPGSSAAGETYTYDSQSVYMASETLPNFGCPSYSSYSNGYFDPSQFTDNSGRPWYRCDASSVYDLRTDKFRLFIEDGQSVSINQAHGRFFASRKIKVGTAKVHDNYTTYYCNSFAEYQQSLFPFSTSNLNADGMTLNLSLPNISCTPFQLGGFIDSIIERYSNYNIFNADGDRIEATPSFSYMPAGTSLIKNYDEILIVNIVMNNSAGRERLFYGMKNGKYYGVVRWDLSVPYNLDLSGPCGDPTYQNCKLQPIQRAIAYFESDDSNVTPTQLMDRGAVLVGP